MARIGIMLEGQEDLTWERFFRLADAVEALGFESLFRSDHLVTFGAHRQRETLELWTSLTALALRTRRLRFGPLVCSMTFRQPALVAKKAAAIDQLSGGRFELGLGAGWFTGEHRMFGIPFPPFATRLEMLDEGAQVVKALWTGQRVSFTGQHYRLEDADTHPSPLQNPPPLIMGGKGERTLHIIAQHATEWNFTYAPIGVFIEKQRRLDEACAAIGRDPKTITRSIMIPFVIGKDAAALQKRIDAQRAMFPDLPSTHADWLAAGYLGGSPAQLIDHIQEREAVGLSRFMLQHNSLDDLDSLELLAREVLPQVV